MFALLSGLMSQRLGRKITILTASAVFTVGSVVMGIANTKEILMVGRLIVGAAIGKIKNLVISKHHDTSIAFKALTSDYLC